MAQLDNKNVVDSMMEYVKQIKAETFSLINQVRLNVGLNTFYFSPILERMGQIHTNEMYTHQFFGHENLFCNKIKTIADRMHYCNAISTFDMVGEVLANCVCINTMEEPASLCKEGKLLSLPSIEVICMRMVKNWLSSEGHRNIILCPDYNFMGLGLLLYPQEINNTKFKCLLVTQNMGRKRYN